MTLADWRCSHCGALLARQTMAAGSHAEIKCAKCNTVNSIRVTSTPGRGLPERYEKR